MKRKGKGKRKKTTQAYQYYFVEIHKQCSAFTVLFSTFFKDFQLGRCSGMNPLKGNTYRVLTMVGFSCLQWIKNIGCTAKMLNTAPVFFPIIQNTNQEMVSILFYYFRASCRILTCQR